MPEVTGIDHVYLAVSDLAKAQAFHDIVPRDTLGFRESEFTLGGDPHVGCACRHFDFVLRPARTPRTVDS